MGAGESTSASCRHEIVLPVVERIVLNLEHVFARYNVMDGVAVIR